MKFGHLWLGMNLRTLVVPDFIKFENHEINESQRHFKSPFSCNPAFQRICSSKKCKGRKEHVFLPEEPSKSNQSAVRGCRPFQHSLVTGKIPTLKIQRWIYRKGAKIQGNTRKYKELQGESPQKAIRVQSQIQALSTQLSDWENTYAATWE